MPDELTDLVTYIRHDIAKKKHQRIYNNRINQCFPIEEAEAQATAIHAFAREHGWTATIRHNRIDVIFRAAIG